MAQFPSTFGKTSGSGRQRFLHPPLPSTTIPDRPPRPPPPSRINFMNWSDRSWLTESAWRRVNARSNSKFYKPRAAPLPNSTRLSIALQNIRVRSLLRCKTLILFVTANFFEFLNLSGKNSYRDWDNNFDPLEKSYCYVAANFLEFLLFVWLNLEESLQRLRQRILAEIDSNCDSLEAIIATPIKAKEAAGSYKFLRFLNPANCSVSLQISWILESWKVIATPLIAKEEWKDGHAHFHVILHIRCLRKFWWKTIKGLRNNNCFQNWSRLLKMPGWHLQMLAKSSWNTVWMPPGHWKSCLKHSRLQRTSLMHLGQGKKNQSQTQLRMRSKKRELWRLLRRLNSMRIIWRLLTDANVKGINRNRMQLGRIKMQKIKERKMINLENKRGLMT